MELQFNWIYDPPVSDQAEPHNGVLSLRTHAPLPSWRGKPKIALVLHGTACVWNFMKPLAIALQETKIYDKIWYIAYDWRKNIEENAYSLAQIVNRIANHAKSIDLHGYSMGGLVAKKAANICSKIIERIFTYNAPHEGTCLANLMDSKLRIIPWFIPALNIWQCDGIRDLIPSSPILKMELEEEIDYTFIAGNKNSNYIRGITKMIFGDIEHDGIASTKSQLDDWNKKAKHIILPWHHFSVLGKNGCQDLLKTTNLF